MNPRRRKLKFTINVRKYHREDFDTISEEHPEYGLDLVFAQIPPERKSETSFDVISWLPSDKDLREIFKDLNDAAAAKFEIMNEETKEYNSKLVNEALENIEDQIKDLHIQHTNLTTELQIIIMNLYKLYTQFNNTTNSDEKNKILEQIAKKNVEKINKDKEIDANSKQMIELENQKKEKENQDIWQFDI